MLLDRRCLLTGSIASAAAIGLRSRVSYGTAGAAQTRVIPSSGERISMVGLGSWITFNVGEDPVLRDESAAVIDAFLDGGGQMIDSSPMYGSAQATIGYGLKKRGARAPLFSADKVWISDGAAGPEQIGTSRARWGVPSFDLLQVHNLVAWERHLETLFEMKAAGRLRYVGITTSHGRRHGDVAKVMAAHPIDFVQLTYNAADREAESRLLPLAREKGIGVIVNRPFQRGALTQAMANEPLPDWAAAVGASSWAQLLLKFVLSHPAVTVAIPATSKVAHVRENLGTATSIMPDADIRARIARAVSEA